MTMKKLYEEGLNHLKRYDWNLYSTPFVYGAIEGEIMYRSGTDDAKLTRHNGNIEIDFRGTDPTALEWCFNMSGFRRQWGTFGAVHRGFGMFVHGLIGDEYDPESMVSQCKNSKGLIILRGHSRGGNLAILSATVLIAHGVDKNRIRVVVFGCPPIGDDKFTERYAELLGSNTITVNGKYDIFSKLPWWGHTHGTLIELITPWIKFNNHSRMSYYKALQDLS